MKDFFKRFFRKGMIILGVIFAIWFICFLINLFFPHFFDFLDKPTTKENVATTTVATTSESFNYRIYHYFFGGSKATTTTSSTTVSDKDKGGFWDASTTVWGGDHATLWGANSSSTTYGGKGVEKLDKNQTYISPNVSNSPIQNMKIDNLLVKTNSVNILSSGSIISGRIFRGFQSQPYFAIYVYDLAGDKLFDFPAIPITDLKDDQYANFTASYSKNYNYKNYSGDAYLVIRSDNVSVLPVILIKIKLNNK